MNPLQIAIDGPAGAGKSTIAKAIARELGITYLDTGAMYRATGLKALRFGVDPADESAASVLAAGTDIAVRHEDGGQRVLLDGEDVTGQIRTAEVSAAASQVSRHRAVRERMVALQRRLAGQIPVVMDGRDIGTVVLPQAAFKFFLTASVEVRAERRRLELLAQGIDRPLEEYSRDIAERDRQDMTRAESPLMVAPGAEVVDTSAMTADEVVAHVLGRVRGYESK